ncbi:MAG: nucleotide sugar dehydrogenase [bacterium]
MAYRIVVVGMGYVGIPCAAVFADVEGFEVIGVQRRSKRSGWKIDYINSGNSPISGKEPGLAELISKVVKNGKLRVTDDISVCSKADAILMDVQTPVDESKEPQFESLKSVAESVGKYLRPWVLVVVESTVPPGTTENIVKPILEEASNLRAGEDFYLAYSLERVRVGRLLANIMELPRIVGGIDETSSKKAVELYKHIVKGDVHSTDCRTAELTKTVENCYRDTNIAFANEIALISESLGVDAYEVRRLANTLENVDVHVPGAGVGGHCLPKDGWLMAYGVSHFGKVSVNPRMVSVTREMNDFMPMHVVELTEDAFREAKMPLEGSRIAVLGVAFLENSDDIRNTPATPVIRGLKDRGASVVAHDPWVQEYEEAELTRDFSKAVQNADCIIVITRHEEYSSVRSRDLEAMRTRIIVDGRNVFDKSEWLRDGFIYRGVGKGR